MRSRIPRSLVRRAAYSIILVAVAEAVGTVGFHAIEGMGWVNAFYMESMLATGQGPPLQLVTDSGKIFASIMGFVSVSSVLSAIILTVGPLLARLWKEGVDAAEVEAKKLEEEAIRGVRRLEEDLGLGRGEHDGPSGAPPAKPPN